MKTSILTVACSAALLAATATGAMSEDRLSGQVSVIAASGVCPAGLVAGSSLLSVHFVMADATILPQTATPNRFRYNFSSAAAKPVTMPLVKISGEIRDYGVKGCTVSFEGGTPARLASALPAAGDDHAMPLRGCRGGCGL